MNDRKWVRMGTKYPGTCHACGKPFKPPELIWIRFKPTKRVLHPGCLSEEEKRDIESCSVKAAMRRIPSKPDPFRDKMIDSLEPDYWGMNHGGHNAE